MSVKYLSILFLLLSSLSFAQPSRKFSQQEVKEDLKYLYETLKASHYDVYAYTSEQAFEETYQKIQKAIAKDSLTVLEASNLMQPLVSNIKNGHTNLLFPVQSYFEYAQNGGTIFPLELAFENGKALIRKNWSANKAIEKGAEVLSINGMPIKDVLEKIYPQISAERPYFKHVMLEALSFPRYYWRVFGRVDSFEVEIRSSDNPKTYQIPAIKVIEGYEMQRDEVLGSPMSLKFYPKSAYLSPGSFSGDEKQYRAFIDSAFVKIKERKVKNLIIDLRNNSGGEDAFSDYLLSYFANKPFQWSSKFTLKTSKLLKEQFKSDKDTSAYWKSILNHKDGEIFEYNFEKYAPQPKAKRFGGKVYVLVNRQSHSQAAVTAAQIQDYKFGKIVGEETGDYPTLYASVFYYNLPNTAIRVQVSKGRIVRVNGSRTEEGVIPDILIRDHLLDEKDEILEGLLQKIGDKH